MDESVLTLLQRLRLRFSAAGVVLSMIVLAAVVALAWVGSAQPAVADLELVALDENGRFGDSISVSADPFAPEPRFPLVLAVRNRGEAAAAPDSLFLNLPARFRLENREGETLPHRYEPGSPLARYVLPLEPRQVVPGAQPGMLPGIDTVWIAPWLPDYYCVTGPAGVPEFVPAPSYEPELLADLLLYYGFHTGREPQQAGLLGLRLDPASLRARSGPAPPLFPTQRIGTAAPLPELPALFEVGQRTEPCGDPDQALMIRSVLWQTPDGGRVIALHTDSIARKRLYDLDRDSIVELVVWDADGDGVFDARRRAQFPIPRWLLPRLPAAPVDSLPADSLGVPGTIGTDTTRADTARAATARADTTGR